MDTNNTTLDQYTAITKAYDHFNERLFGGALPPCLITLQRQANSDGYYIPAKFEARDAGHAVTAELALNPDAFRGKTDMDILAVLVHQMAHHWQHVEGDAPRKAYHDTAWAGRMMAMGLHPTDDGTPTGKPTGQNVTQLVVDGGLFEEAAADFLVDVGQAIAWQSVAAVEGRKTSKHKFSCPDCKQNAWGAPTLRIMCAPCDQPMVKVG
jgi:predicted SprT family Zn-dependent metalloprotease